MDMQVSNTAIKRQPPKMSYAECRQRKVEKENIILKFLADHEVYTTVRNIELLLGVCRQNATNTLDSMVKDGSLRKEMHCFDETRQRERSIKYSGKQVIKMLQSVQKIDDIEGIIKYIRIDMHPIITKKGLTNLYYLTRHGAAKADCFDAPTYNKSPTDNFIRHRLDGQIARIKSEQAGIINWMPERKIMVELISNKQTKTGQKIPDALCKIPAGLKLGTYTCVNDTCLAIEVERNAKTTKRYTKFIADHLGAIYAKKYAGVTIITPDGETKRCVIDAMKRCIGEKIHVKKVGIGLITEHKLDQTFRVVTLDEFPKTWPDKNQFSA